MMEMAYEMVDHLVNSLLNSYIALSETTHLSQYNMGFRLTCLYPMT
jgi:hypothetical protein